jgi:hypothetical protein
MRKNGLILTIALLALLIPIFLLEQSVLHHTDGNIVFPLDNAFVDITVARNLSFYQVWGISKYAFQPAAASLLYPVLLALIFFITGAHLIIPVILNTLAAITLLFTLQQALIRRNVKPIFQLTTLLLVILLIPLPLLVVSGMSYTLQLLFGFLFIESLAQALNNNPNPLPRSVYLYAFLAVAARYEDILLIALACLLLVFLRRKIEALKLAGISLLPIVLFGTISVIKGSYFLPTPLILGPYPAYLLVLVLAALTTSVILIRQHRKIGINRLSLSLITIMAIPFAVHNGAMLHDFQQDSIRIYQQQYPMAAFVHRYYHRSTIGVNDIGAVAWFSEGRKLDYNGIASTDIAKSKKERSWGPIMADSLSRKDGVQAAIVSDPWFSPQRFPRWFKVASWKLPDTQFSHGEVLTFYAVNKWDTTWLQKRLHEFEPQLPAGIAVHYY